MARGESLTIYLPDGIIDAARDGRHNFFARVMAAVRGQGWQVDLCPDNLAERVKAIARPGYALTLMEDPPARGLVCRHTYVGAFWHIEASPRRWEWPVARAPFAPDTIDPVEARAFADRWRRRLFKGAADAPRREGFVFVPLQGMLFDHRSFQAMSPLEMLESVLDEMPQSPVLATLHPKETYTPAELQALQSLTARYPRPQGRDRRRHRGACRLRSGGHAKFWCRLQRSISSTSPPCCLPKPYFHHIAASVPRLGVAAAFRAVRDAAPDYDRYLKWFLADNAIAAGNDQAEAQILAALRRGAWPI